MYKGPRVASPEQLGAAGRASRTEADREVLARLRRQVGWYEAARAFGRIASERGGAMAPRERWHDNVIATGGGGGIMEAARRGAHEAGAPSSGYNTPLTTEPQPNRHITQELALLL